MKSQIPFNKPVCGKSMELWIGLFIIAAVLIIYWRVGGYEFINFDDPQYVIENGHIRDGITLEGIRWAFGSMYASNWHPATWLSHMLDVQFYGMNPGAHHRTNVLLHAFNSLLLFLLFHRMTGALWRSAAIAALFAVHPLHVESVAWVSERKDLLSAFFGFLALLAYAEFVKRPGWFRYAASLIFFGLGLMSKPMVVTFPFVMLLLDYWPLNRYADGGGIRRFGVLIGEKIPFFVLSAASSALTIIAQRSTGAVAALGACPIGMRLTNAVAAYVQYIGKLFWPVNLSVFYPHPGLRPLWHIVGAVLLIAGISVASGWWIRRRPWFAVGWFLYLGTLVPVIGLVQVGSQAMADRYTYIPFIGLFIILVWSLHEVLQRWRIGSWVLPLASMPVIVVLMMLTWSQVGYWQNSITLYSHALNATDENWLVHNNLGLALAETGKTSEAISHYSEAICINNYGNAHNNLGLALAKIGKIREAISHYSEAIRISNDGNAHNNLGLALAEIGKTSEAISHYSEAIRIMPNDSAAYYNMGIAIVKQNGLDKAFVSYFKTIANDPAQDICLDMQKALEAQDAIGRAQALFEKALSIDPGHAGSLNNIGALMICQGRIKDAVSRFRRSAEIDPSIGAPNNLKQAIWAIRKLDKNIEEMQKLIQNRDDIQTRRRLGNLYARSGQFQSAIAQYEKIFEKQPNFKENLMALAVAAAMDKHYDLSIGWLKKLVAFEAENAQYDFSIACLYSLQNEKQDALNWLKTAIEKGYQDLETIRQDSCFNNLKSDSRFDELLSQLNSENSDPENIESRTED